MNGALGVVPHPTGDWVVIANGRSLTVPPDVGRALWPLRGRRPRTAEVQSALVDSGPDGAQILASVLCSRPAPNGRFARRRALWLRVPLVPERIVASGAVRLASLASWVGLGTLAGIGSAGYALALLGEPAPAIAPDSVPVAITLFLLTALWHEFGHAAALGREGYPPGGIGGGLLFLLPVLYADVTAIGALAPRGRARVDLAGVGFQFGLGGLLAGAGIWWPPARAAAWAALFAVSWSLLPFIRSDGYWLLCDLLDLPDLRRAPPPERGRPLRWFVKGFRLLNAVFLVAVTILIGSRLVGAARMLPDLWTRL